MVSMGMTAGSVNEMLTANMTMNQLLTATAGAMSSQGESQAEIDVLNALRGQVTATTLGTFKLGDFFTVASGADNAALASEMNVFQLVTAAAQVANGSNFVNVDNIGITVPGVLSTKVSLQVIEAPKFYFGPVGGSVSTGQINLTVTPSLNLSVSVLGLTSLVSPHELPVKSPAPAPPEH